ncbi:hypothetical protein [Lysinibacter cavernae]|uniref:hypothetical protein n=1 Tax=Lysinibacter cavernae TaxID=1640652 RepID=UPI003609ED76
MGWPTHWIAGELALSLSATNEILGDGEINVSSDLARRIEQLFVDSWNVLPLPATKSQIEDVLSAKRKAKRNRWVGPLHWDDIDTDVTPPAASRDVIVFDESAVAIACTGIEMKLTAKERSEAVRRLSETSLTSKEIATLLHTSDRTVCRIRAKLGIPTARQTELVERRSQLQEA